MHRFVVLLIILSLALVAPGCGSKSSSSSSSQGASTTSASTSTGKTHLAKTKFVLHAGLAFGAFHRYILKPYRAGALAKGAPGRTKALAKAGASALFAYHELKVARTDAVCDGPRLRRLADSVSSALASLNALRALRAGTGLGAIGLAGQALDRLGGEAASGGTPIKDINR
jgi:uncharacterized protein YceK